MLPILLLSLGALPAHASVIGSPHCKATVVIEERAAEYITGHLEGENCGPYSAMRVEISDDLNHIPFNLVSHIILRVQPVSSMGPNGPVEGHHWEVIDIGISKEADISRISTEFVTVKILNTQDK